jgi:hypothetical protein
LAERLAKGYSGAVERLREKTRRNNLEADAAFVRAEFELMGDIPTDQWAEIRHPDLATTGLLRSPRHPAFLGSIVSIK